MDILAVGFDPKLTFIFTDTDTIGQMYPNILRIQKSVIPEANTESLLRFPALRGVQWADT